MMERRTLTPTQIRYLKIGPKAGNSKVLKKQLIDILELEKQQEFAQTSAENGNMNKIPKFTFGEFQKTVNNFGVLINKNFGTQTTLHQIQKFGKLAQQVDKNLHNEKDKPLLQEKINSNRKGNKIDKRTFLKSIYNYNGQKIFVMLHSFSIEVKGDNYKQFLNFQVMKTLLEHVNSSKLTKIVQNCLNIQNEEIGIDQHFLYQKTHTLKNNEQKYQNIPFKFQKLGAEFKIILPYLQFSHIQSDFKQIVNHVSNKDILQIVSQQFDNVHDIVFKYFDHQKFLIVNGPVQTLQHQGKEQDQQNIQNNDQGKNEQNEQNYQNQQGQDQNNQQQMLEQDQNNFQKEEEVVEYGQQQNHQHQELEENHIAQMQQITPTGQDQQLQNKPNTIITS